MEECGNTQLFFWSHMLPSAEKKVYGRTRKGEEGVCVRGNSGRRVEWKGVRRGGEGRGEGVQGSTGEKRACERVCMKSARVKINQRY